MPEPLHPPAYAGGVSAELINETGGKGFDVIVSSLPWSAFSGELQNELLEAIQRSLAEGGKFVTPIYLWSYPFLTSWKFRRRLRKIFPEVRSVRTVWKNLPPTFVYVAEKTKNTR